MVELKIAYDKNHQSRGRGNEVLVTLAIRHYYYTRVDKSPSPRKASTSSQVLPYEEEADECEDRTTKEDIHILGTENL